MKIGGQSAGAKATGKADKPKGKAAKLKDKEEKKESKRPRDKAAGKLSLGKSKRGGKQFEEAVEVNQVEPVDEVISPDTPVTQAESATLESLASEVKEALQVSVIPPFTAGIVSSSLQNASNAQWAKNDETVLLVEAMQTVYIAEGVFVGDIASKPSFVKRSKGVVLL